MSRVLPSLREAKSHWDDIQLKPSEVTFSVESLIRGTPEPQEVNRLAVALTLSSGRGATPHAESMLIAAIGPTLAARVLERTHTRSRWGTLVDMVDGSPSRQSVPSQVVTRLRREVSSEIAQNLRKGLSEAQSRQAIDDHLSAARGAGLSSITLSTLLREAVPKYGLLLRRDAESLLGGLAVEVEVQSLFACAGDVTHLRDVEPKLMINDECLFLDAFELFVEANDRALKVICDVSEYVGDVVRHGGALETHSGGASLQSLVEDLQAEVRMMKSWYDAMSENATLTTKLKDVFTKLDRATDQLQRTMALGYQRSGGASLGAQSGSDPMPTHVRRDFDAFVGVLSKSKPQVTIDTIETVEELIRVLHREVASLYGQHVRNFASKQLVLRKTHPVHERSAITGNDRTISLTYVGEHSPESFVDTPMGKVREALKNYIRACGNATRVIKGGVITDKTMSFDLRLGAHTGRLNITYDSGSDLYFVDWGMQEPGSSQKRIDFCRKFFKVLGYEYAVDGTKHSARRKVNPDDITRSVWLMMFSLDNMLDLDLSAGRLSEHAMLAVFNRYYAHVSADMAAAAAATPAAADAKPAECSAPDRNTVLELIKSDDFNFFAAESAQSTSRDTLVRAVLMFGVKHAGVLGLADPPTKEQLIERLSLVLKVYIEDVRSGIIDEVQKLEIKLSNYEVETISEKLEAFIKDADLSGTLKDVCDRFRYCDRGLVGPVFQRAV